SPVSDAPPASEASPPPAPDTPRFSPRPRPPALPPILHDPGPLVPMSLVVVGVIGLLALLLLLLLTA
ncbi:MAG TPA: hypothetical protein VM262_12030, partial [Acidimicrobiales bacterium]|nr:hypothetical protein [Acidimicrobiales bacterium]